MISWRPCCPGRSAGRANLLRRLGEEARDPLEELLSQALAYEQVAAPRCRDFSTGWRPLKISR